MVLTGKYFLPGVGVPGFDWFIAEIWKQPVDAFGLSRAWHTRDAATAWCAVVEEQRAGQAGRSACQEPCCKCAICRLSPSLRFTPPCAVGARLEAKAGASRRRNQRQAACYASPRQQAGAADGREPYGSSDSIDAEWQSVKLQPVWQRLDAELDCRATHSVAEEVTATFDDNASSGSSAVPTLDSLPGRNSVPDALWPSLAARHAVYSSSGNQQALLQDLSQVYVILFGVGSTDTEGIYSLRVMSRDDGLPQDTIIAFSCKEDADRYAGLLEATMDHVPSVCPIEPAELLDFCTDSGYSYRVEAQGSLLIPPDYYVGMTDWERSLRLREGKWTVMDRDVPSPSGSPAEHAHAADHQPQPLNNANFYPLSEPSYLLEEARASLERLLTRDC